MNWITFSTYTGVCYALYYLVLILADQKLSARIKGSAEEVQRVYFEQEPVPVKVAAEPETPNDQDEPATVGLSGMKMQDFFALARTEALQYTRPVSF